MLLARAVQGIDFCNSLCPVSENGVVETKKDHVVDLY